MFSKLLKISLTLFTLLFLLGAAALIGGGAVLGSSCPDLPPCSRPGLPPCPGLTPPPCPSPSPSPSPSPTPTPPPAETPTPTPTTPPPSDDGNGEDGGNGGPAPCGSEKPPTPTLLSVTPSSSVDLTWTAVEPATHYAIAYGLSSGDYIYGVDNTGNVTAYNVGGLDPAADYCFAVRAVNDCAPGDLSNEICTDEVLGAGQVLGATTLADTGNFGDDLFRILFIISNVCLGLGLRFLLPVRKTV